MLCLERKSSRKAHAPQAGYGLVHQARTLAGTWIAKLTKLSLFPGCLG